MNCTERFYNNLLSFDKKNSRDCTWGPGNAKLSTKVKYFAQKISLAECLT